MKRVGFTIVNCFRLLFLQWPLEVALNKGAIMVRRFPSNIWAYGLLLAGGLSFHPSAISLGGDISSEALQINRLSWIDARLQKYATDHHKLPNQLTDLPEEADKDNGIIDGWGSPIDYRPQSDGSVILTSKGPAGTGNFRSIQFSIVPKEDEFAEDWTFVMMCDTERELRDFFKNHREMPHDLSGIHPEEWTLDGWNKRLEYKVSADGKVTLTSHGKTGEQIFVWQFVIAELQTTKPTTAP